MKNVNITAGAELNITYNIFHSSHSQLRATQRNINEEDIQIALNYSESIFKQGIVFHVVKFNMIPLDLPEPIKSRIRNMVIIMSKNNGEVITCYRSKKALHRIKCKSKRLYKHNHKALTMREQLRLAKYSIN